jgi:integrase
MAALARIYKESDSFKAKIMKAALASRGAAILTKVKISTVANNLERYAKVQRWGKANPENLTFKQVKAFILFRKDEGISIRSLQNDMSIIRRALEGVGREDFAQKICSNSALGIDKATRIGDGAVVDPLILDSALQSAAASTKALILLSRYLGLRIREAVMSSDSINEWVIALSQGRPIIIRNGTKGGRLRSVMVVPEILENALEAVRAAQQILRDQKYLVVSKNLKAAIEQHSDRLAKLGLKEDNSCHSLRRAFAMDQYRHYLSIGCSEKIALSRTSNDLGHGDSRGRWVYNNYLRKTIERENFETVRSDSTNA